MEQDINSLCKDPLFQLNLAIWLTQPQHADNVCVDPIFYKSGLSIYSIGPLLTLPLDIKLAIKGKINFKDSIRPDLILEKKELNRYCLLECKGSSFGSGSSTAEQARTLLLIAGPIISEVLGVGSRRQNAGVLCYMTGPNQNSMLGTTLLELKEEIESIGLEPGPFGCIEISADESVITLEYSLEVKELLSLKIDSPLQIMKLEKDTDPRPLYFIPYDPNINQTAEEKEFSRRVLFERILEFFITNIGGADVPIKTYIKTEKFLNDATFGMYSIWDDDEAKKCLRKLVRTFLKKIEGTLKTPAKECMHYEIEDGYMVDIKDDNAKSEFLKQLQKIKPETMGVSERVQPSLFEYDDHD